MIIGSVSTTRAARTGVGGAAPVGAECASIAGHNRFVMFGWFNQFKYRKGAIPQHLSDATTQAAATTKT